MRLLLLLALCASGALASIGKIGRIPIRKAKLTSLSSRSSRPYLTNGLGDDKIPLNNFLDAQVGLLHQQGKHDDRGSPLPCTQYYGEIMLGTPPQKFQASLSRLAQRRM